MTYVHNNGRCSGDWSLDGGCLGESNEQQPQPGDEPVIPKSPAWFATNGTVLQRKRADTLKITESSLFRTPDGFGVLGTVKNTGKQAYVRVQIHAQLTGGNEVIGNGVAISESEAVDDLGVGERWHWRLEFEDTDPDALVQGNNSTDEIPNHQVSYQVWATGHLQ